MPTGTVDLVITLGASDIVATTQVPRIVMPTVVGFNFDNDAAAKQGGIPLGGIYHTSGALKIRIN